MNNAERDQALYRYPDSNVLRNKLDIRDYDILQEAEKQLVQDRGLEGMPTGNFDLAHLQAIHKHLFQDVYEWAGEIRKTDIHKTHWFMPYGRIEMGMNDVHKRLSGQNFLRGLSANKFAQEAAEYIGDVNRIHPFREGNGRTQFQYLQQLGQQAGHSIDLTRFDRESWIKASIESHDFKCERMAECIARGMETTPHEKMLEDRAVEALERLRDIQAERQTEQQGKRPDKDDEPER